MSIYKAIKLDIEKKGIISFVGGGGKTTAIFQLAKELTKLDKKILISTTTKIFTPSKGEYDYFFLKDIVQGFNPHNSTITILGKEIEDDKLMGIFLEKVDEIYEKDIFDIILIEADGSNRRSIKAPGSHEPVVPKSSTKTIGVIGLDSLGKTINENIVHRPQLLCEMVGKNLLDVIDEEVIIKLVLEKNGLFKDTYGDKILLLNKADDEKKVTSAIKIRERLNAHGFKNVIIADIFSKKFY